MDMEQKNTAVETLKEKYTSPMVEFLVIDDEDIIVTSVGNGDQGRGKGQGGGCDGVPGHSNQRSFSNGNGSGC